jgi:hypothetical protein
MARLLLSHGGPMQGSGAGGWDQGSPAGSKTQLPTRGGAASSKATLGPCHATQCTTCSSATTGWQEQSTGSVQPAMVSANG